VVFFYSLFGKERRPNKIRKVATVVLMAAVVLLGFPVTEVVVWSCALVGGYMFSHLVTGIVWMGLERRIGRWSLGNI